MTKALFQCLYVLVVVMTLVMITCFHVTLESAARAKWPTRFGASRTKWIPGLEKNILFWSKKLDALASNSQFCGPCVATYDRSKLTDPNTAVVIFPLRSPTFKDFPSYNSRRSEQLYIWQSGESPSQSQRIFSQRNLDLRQIEDYYFNGTLTYRRDSLVQRLYTQKLQAELALKNDNDVEGLLKKKRKSAIWFANNNERGSNAARRLVLSEELIQNGLALDRYGKCFNKTDVARNGRGFLETISEYRFFMAFENSYHCRDYITEKFFDALRGGAVPVVSGATKEDYEYHAPPHSYIHVEDFGSTKELVDYLHYLERNRTAYEEYFAWRKLDPLKYHPFGKQHPNCLLCRAAFGISLNDSRSFTDIYGKNGEGYDSKIGFSFTARLKSVYQWWYGIESRECLKTEDKFQKRTDC